MRIILFSFTGDLIDEGTGSILHLTYDISEEAPAGECRNLNLKNIQITDENRNPLEATVLNGEFCFRSNYCVPEEIYGEESDEVHLLRKYQDKVLSKTPEGQETIRLHYTWTPTILKALEEDEELKEEVQSLFDRVLPLIKAEIE